MNKRWMILATVSVGILATVAWTRAGDTWSEQLAKTSFARSGPKEESRINQGKATDEYRQKVDGVPLEFPSRNFGVIVPARAERATISVSPLAVLVGLRLPKNQTVVLYSGHASFRECVTAAAHNMRRVLAQSDRKLLDELAKAHLQKTDEERFLSCLRQTVDSMAAAGADKAKAMEVYAGLLARKTLEIGQAYTKFTVNQRRLYVGATAWPPPSGSHSDIWVFDDKGELLGTLAVSSGAVGEGIRVAASFCRLRADE